jgi:hypothetical protein
LYPKTIGYVSDLHCGSHFGLWPESRLPNDENRHVAVRYLNECFQYMVAKWPMLDLLILNGDLIDGKQRKDKGVSLFTPDMSEQVDGAIDVLRPLIAKAKRVVRCKGTPYHEGFDGALCQLDEAFGVGLVDQVLDIELNPGRILNVAHHPNGTPELEMRLASQRAAESKLHLPTWIVRAHKHDYYELKREQMHYIGMPCFEMPTPYAIKTGYFKFQPSLGGMLMIRDESGLERFGYRVIPELFGVPAAPVYFLNEIPERRTA